MSEQVLTITAYHSVLPPTDLSSAQTCRAKFAQLFCLGMVRIGKYATGCYRQGAWGCIPYSRKRWSGQDKNNPSCSRRLWNDLSAHHRLSGRGCLSAETERNQHRKQNTWECMVKRLPVSREQIGVLCRRTRIAEIGPISAILVAHYQFSSHTPLGQYHPPHCRHVLVR